MATVRCLGAGSSSSGLPPQVCQSAAGGAEGQAAAKGRHPQSAAGEAEGQAAAKGETSSEGEVDATSTVPIEEVRGSTVAVEVHEPTAMAQTVAEITGWSSKIIITRSSKGLQQQQQQ